MAEGFNNESDGVEVNDTKASVSVYYTLAMEKIRDVSAFMPYFIIHFYILISK